MNATRHNKRGFGVAVVAIVAMALFAGCIDEDAPLPIVTTTPCPPDDTPVYGYKIINTYPHDRNAFTQGLVFDNGFLYEGTGIFGKSSLRKSELETGKVIKSYHLPDKFFGEGVALWDDKLIQLTWQSHVGFVYDKDSFLILQEFSYPTEGWGLTHDGKHLIMSDGTATLYFLNPDTFDEVGRIEVRSRDMPITNLNELEYIKGAIYANVWLTDSIAIISPETGQVAGWLCLEGLLSEEGGSQPVNVLNGIAYDAKHDRLFVTGKYWPKLYEIRATYPQNSVSTSTRPPSV